MRRNSLLCACRLQFFGPITVLLLIGAAPGARTLTCTIRVFTSPTILPSDRNCWVGRFPLSHRD